MTSVFLTQIQVVESVSYTHLDVYKRQALARYAAAKVKRRRGGDGVLRRSALAGLVPRAEQARERVCHEYLQLQSASGFSVVASPVSYTHLGIPMRRYSFPYSTNDNKEIHFPYSLTVPLLLGII